MATRFEFTKARIKELQPPATGRLTVHDSKVRGLQLRVTEAGGKFFYLRRRLVNGTAARIKLGRYGQLDLPTARQLAADMNNKIAAGVDVAQLRADARDEQRCGNCSGVILPIARSAASAASQRCSSLPNCGCCRCQIAHRRSTAASAPSRARVWIGAGAHFGNHAQQGSGAALAHPSNRQTRHQ